MARRRPNGSKVTGGKARAADANSPRPRSSAASDTSSYSIRLTEAERELVFKAAEVKGWTPTNLIKQSALERSAWIVNLASPTKIDFGGLTRRLATQLCEPKLVVWDQDDPASGTDSIKEYLRPGLPPSTVATTDPPPLWADDIALLRRAVQYGGSEFVNRLVEECDVLLRRDLDTLPDPVDPSKLD